MNRLFPFGQPLHAIEQTDRRPKRVFVLGAYASAVHARWVGPDNREIVRALAVASEPRIFWRGDRVEAETIVSRIKIPAEAGRLFPADEQLNGPSGRALDDHILKPLALQRKEAWLCDLVPHGCMNSGQKKAVEEQYLPVAQRLGLPVPSVPEVPEQLTDEARRQGILHELRASKARLLILLGDEPIKWFLRFFADCPRGLAQFRPYGLINRFDIAGMELGVLPLVHPRQAARLGAASDAWFTKHQVWEKEVAPKLSGEQGSRRR